MSTAATHNGFRAGATLRSYTWGPGIDNLLAITVHSGETTNTYRALTDHLGTVHALADETGVVVESYRYDAFAEVSLQSRAKYFF